MSDNHDNNQVSREMEAFKIRMYTNIPPNAVLVGHNVFTKNKKVYSKAMFHMPWLRSRFISIETQNLDLKPENIEIGDKGLEAVADFAISYKISGLEKKNKLTIKDRWMSVLDGFMRPEKRISSILKAAAVGVGAIGAGILLGPIGFGALGVGAVLAGTATYTTFFHQNEEWLERQGAVTAAYNNASAMKELEQIVYNELRVYYGKHSYEEVKSKNLDLNDPDLIDLKNALDTFKLDYGIEVKRVVNKKLDLTPKSNEVLQKKRQLEIDRENLALTAQVDLEVAEKRDEIAKIAQARRNSQIQDLLNQGMDRDEIIRLLETDALAQSRANVIVSRGGTPVTPVVSIPTETTTGDDEASMGHGPRR